MLLYVYMAFVFLHNYWKPVFCLLCWFVDAGLKVHL